MSDSESADYLQPGFDPKSLTIPRLRSILVAHNVPYSSSAKKGQLVEIFNDQIVPQSRKLLNARTRAKRSSKGIFDAESISSSSNPFDEHEDLAPPPPAACQHQEIAIAPESVGQDQIRRTDSEPAMPAPVPSSPSKRASRLPSRQISDTETASTLDGSAVLGKTRWDATPPAQNRGVGWSL